MPNFKPVEEQLAYLRKGVAEIIPENEFRAKLEQSLKTGKPLRVKLGVDPTAPDLHLGHTVVMRKLKHFQDLGHTAIFLIGGFTAMVGDPTGQSETRPPLTRAQVDANAKTYLDQAFHILDPKKTEVVNNADWLGKLTSIEMIQLGAKYRLARMLEREDFRSRLSSNQPISVHELFYPLLVAYDSVEVNSDVELGATEQKFNLLIGREIQREYGKPQQIAMTMPILVGLDGERKMSKSLNNYVGITEPPQQMFGKLMSISDAQMWIYYELLTDFDERTITRLKQEVHDGDLPPIDAKMRLAHTVIAGFHGESAAKKAAEEFQRVFRDRQAPTEIVEYKVQRTGTRQVILHKKQGSIITSEMMAPFEFAPKLTWAKLLVWLKEYSSKGEAERLLKQGGLEVNGQRMEDVSATIDLETPGEFLVRAGKKRFFRLVVV